MLVSIIVPCFRSAATLPALIHRLGVTLPDHTAGHEIVLVVDDGEADTWAVAADLARRHADVRAIQLSRNFGQHNALIAGIRAARHDVVVTMDDDLQHPPEEVPALLRALGPEIDLVYGVPDREEHGASRSLASRTVKALLARVLGVRHARDLSAFRAFRSFLSAGFDRISGPHVSVDVALSWGTTRIAATTVAMRRRESGESGYTVRALRRYALNLLVGYSTLPLRLVTWIGFAVGLLGVGCSSSSSTSTPPGPPRSPASRPSRRWWRSSPPRSWSRSGCSASTSAASTPGGWVAPRTSSGSGRTATSRCRWPTWRRPAAQPGRWARNMSDTPGKPRTGR
jgi:undecaprenyl-phosphate 4-deoxy-4-formamido-L-arabinose transferase